ncbi:hypothetical protein Scep_023073 [Stephania cephalantha]|uniref:Uncharacterized protein n=1 Tax=Stephania cephalantha TaxID=152367 RepID=A0AAP0I330_9MAGN
MISIVHLLCWLVTIFIKEVCSSPVDYDERYLNCSVPFNCGRNSYIQYPFWGGSRAEYCGRAGYHLECLNNDTTVIEINSLEYKVLEVYQETQTLRIARLDYMDTVCPSNYSDSILDLNLFDYTPDTLNLTIFYGCTSTRMQIVKTQFQFTCGGTNLNGCFDVSRNEAEEVPLPGPAKCRWRVVVPIPEVDAERLESGSSTLSDVLRNGFEAKHHVNMSQCMECGKSGGSCGFDQLLQRPTCFCYDGPRRQGHCPYRPPSGTYVPIYVPTYTFNIQFDSIRFDSC